MRRMSGRSVAAVVAMILSLPAAQAESPNLGRVRADLANESGPALFDGVALGAPLELPECAERPVAQRELPLTQACQVYAGMDPSAAHPVRRVVRQVYLPAATAPAWLAPSVMPTRAHLPRPQAVVAIQDGVIVRVDFQSRPDDCLRVQAWLSGKIGQPVFTGGNPGAETAEWRQNRIAASSSCNLPDGPFYRFGNVPWSGPQERVAAHSVRLGSLFMAQNPLPAAPQAEPASRPAVPPRPPGAVSSDGTHRTAPSPSPPSGTGPTR